MLFASKNARKTIICICKKKPDGILGIVFVNIPKCWLLMAQNDARDLVSWLHANGLTEPSVLEKLNEHHITLSTLLESTVEDIRDLCQDWEFSPVTKLKLVSAYRETKKREKEEEEEEKEAAPKVRVKESEDKIKKKKRGPKEKKERDKKKKGSHEKAKVKIKKVK
ncbi:hypothetical protein RFI_23127, partial [Reticulomyxa filosa]